MLKFAANLEFMFTGEASTLVERMKLAAAAGFTAIEIPCPYDLPPSVLASAKEASGVEQVLINSWPGYRSAGDSGIGIFSSRCEEFKETLELSLTYLKALDCHCMQIMSGMIPKSATDNVDIDKEFEETYVTNLQYAADRLQREGVLAVIEAVCSRAKPGCWLNDPATAERLVRRVDHPNLKLQFDVFHSQIVGGDLSHRIREWAPIIGHVQISQVPNRDEPDSPGELNYRYIFDLLRQSGYSGWIGLEYRPRAATVDGLGWLRDWGYWT